MTQPPADPLVGTTVAQYDILAKIGGGGMGVVYAARDTKLGRLVALKFLPPQWSHDEGAKQRFVREAQAASATDHRNICTIHDIGFTGDGRLFIVMAHYDGQTLKHKLEAGPLDIDTAIEIAAQVAEGLAKAHAQGVVHRDIKPGNLMVTDEAVKILDFGLAKFATALQLTIEGSTLGTAAYMSPEQVKGEETDARSDLWSLGVVLYEMLAGRVPFHGAYAEAVAYAIRNETPTSLRALRPEVPEALEQIVFRALHKEPAVRFQSARDVARALRMLQGRTMMQDLLTEPLPEVRRSSLAPTPAAPPRRAWRRPAAIAAAVLAVIVAGAYPLLTRAVERVPVVVAPMANQTGYPELDPYRLALTQTLTAELADSPNVRVLPYARLLQIIRRFLVRGADMSSRDAVQAIAMRGAARLVIVPTLRYENGSWRGRAEIQDAATATNVAVYDTEPVVSTLAKDTAYGITASLAREVEEHFEANGPGASYTPRSPSSRFRSLDAAKSFEEGFNAYEELEYSAARSAFSRAVEQDARNPLALAWRSRVAQILRLPDEAAEAADRAAQLVTEETPRRDAAFVAAVRAEARRDYPAAEARYRELVASFADEPQWLLELAGFQDRRIGAQEAVASYHAALAMDPGAVRVHLELCRLYNRLNDSALARQHGERALTEYVALGARGGEAQAHMCLADNLRVGDDARRAEAKRHAEQALTLLSDLNSPYNLARAYYYVAATALHLGNPDEGVRVGQQALALARQSGNAVVEPLILGNLGVAHEALGDPARAADYYQQSYRIDESTGNEPRAAQNRANRAAVLIQYVDPEEGFRDVQNALAVVRKLGDKNFEAFCLQLMAVYYRNAGRHADAERELNVALAIARERNLEDDIGPLRMDLARSYFDRSDYARARQELVEVLGDGTGPRSLEARIRLARVDVALGDFASAGDALAEAARQAGAARYAALLPLLRLVTGELAYESGRHGDARQQFDQAVALSKREYVDPDSLEARAFVGLLDALQGRLSLAVGTLQETVDQARARGRFAIEGRARAYLARALVLAGRHDEAVDVLAPLQPDDTRQLSAELAAQVHFWRGRALAARGDRAAADTETMVARRLVETLGASLPERYRSTFSSREGVRMPAG